MCMYVYGSMYITYTGECTGDMEEYMVRNCWSLEWTRDTRMSFRVCVYICVCAFVCMCIYVCVIWEKVVCSC